LSFEEKQAISMFARRYPLLGKARADEIARGYTERKGLTAERGSTADSGTAGEEGLSPSAWLLGIAQVLENGP
jgi:hypothetical protein